MNLFWKRSTKSPTGAVAPVVNLPEPPTRQYAEILVERRKQYAKFFSRNQVSEVVVDWANRMSRKCGVRVKVWHNELDWVSALYVVRWGEAVEHWPKQLSEKDIERAFRWERGEIPAAVSYIERSAVA